MIFVVEVPHDGHPHAWFAFEGADLLGKIAAEDAFQEWEIFDRTSARELFELVGAVPDAPDASEAFPGISRLAQEYGLDTPLYRADHLLERGCYQPAAVSLEAACEAALKRRKLPAREGGVLRDYRVYWSEPDAVLAIESQDPFFAEHGNWRALHALREQLLALDVLAAD
ncbi:MAG: hypothetical protein EPO09_08915 [Aquabacterium sp.]|uniref:hypothetical protein n=1 Tax=Aquabacterium sp. TaxID=1872578 RepID=UPI001216077E|nr:hypothetical protein [Aquabacterium sp.]TAK94793.1 MAG: hypothetical protein EPO09_08915 [Aquabacterium sp.]